MGVTDLSRVKTELKAVGVGAVGMRAPEVNELAKILHPDEHIGGVVYGRYSNGLAWLVATDKRVLFVDKKAFFMTTDELTYDVVSGVKNSHAGVFASIVLHTRVNDYAIRYVSLKCARIFTEFIEARRLEGGRYDVATGRHEETNLELPVFQNVSEEGLNFLKSHDLAVLSTVDRTGNVHGAVVYYLVDENNFVYILTKSDTGKGRNVYAHSQVALTIHQAGTMQTVQLQGTAEVETNQATKEKVFSDMVKPRPYGGKMQLPPVTKLHEGAFMVIRINPTLISFHDYAKTE
jgi:general stress protein 26